MLNLIPYPQKVELTGRTLVFPANAVMTRAAKRPFHTLKTFARRIHSVKFSAIADNGFTSVRFRSSAALAADAYVLTVDASGVTIEASGEAGWQNGVSTLVQLMSPVGGSRFSVPEGVIEDAPDCSWRAVMIDLARDWHPFPFLLEYVDMCRFYKIRTLHLHFTDDQSYTLPSRAFPKLSTEGRSYTEKEIRRLCAYARLRGVEIMPEIDVPGHCTSFAQAYGDIFGTNGIISQSEPSMTCMEALFRELCGLFPDSPYIHIGGDEAAIEKWTDCPKCLDAYRARGVDVDGILAGENGKHKLSEIMYATFIKRTADAVLSCGKTPVVWEGFAAEVNGIIPPETVVMSWENFYQVTPSLQAAGFRLLNCSWSPLYIVTPVVYWKPEDVYNWNVYTWRPVHPGSPYAGSSLTIEPTMQVEGGQLLAWGDQIVAKYANVTEGVREEQRLVEERTPALSENLWHREKISDWTEFSARMAIVAALYETFREHK